MGGVALGAIGLSLGPTAPAMATDLGGVGFTTTFSLPNTVDAAAPYTNSGAAAGLTLETTNSTASGIEFGDP